MTTDLLLGIVIGILLVMFAIGIAGVGLKGWKE